MVAGSRADLAKTGVGVVVKAGAPLPNIGSVDAFKRCGVLCSVLGRSADAGRIDGEILDVCGQRADPQCAGQVFGRAACGADHQGQRHGAGFLKGR